MFYIIAQGARISTPIDQLLKSTNITPIAASTAVKAVSTHSDKVAEKNLSKKQTFIKNPKVRIVSLLSVQGCVTHEKS